MGTQQYVIFIISSTACRQLAFEIFRMIVQGSKGALYDMIQIADAPTKSRLCCAGCPLQCICNRLAPMGTTSSVMMRISAGSGIVPLFPSIVHIPAR